MLNYNRKQIETNILDIQKLDKFIKNTNNEKILDITNSETKENSEHKQLSQDGEKDKNTNLHNSPINNQMIQNNNQMKQKNDQMNLPQTIFETNMIIVETNYEKKQFIFYDKNKKFIGEFTILQLIKYVISNPIFLEGVDYNSAIPIIEKFVCISKDNEIKLINYLESPFMANIETLIKFYTFINSFESTQLQYELQKIINDYDRKQVSMMFNKLLYVLLNHILQIIAIMTGRITTEQFCVKDKLLNYSVAIVYKLTKLINNEMIAKNIELEKLNENTNKIELEKNQLNQKLDDIQNKLTKQNNEIDLLVRTIILNKDNESDIIVDSSPINHTTSNSSINDFQSSIDINDYQQPSQSSQTSIVTSSLDKTNIYNIDTETGKATLKNVKYNDLLENIGESKLSTNNVESFMDMLNSHMTNSSSHLNSFESVHNPDKNINYLSSTNDKN